MAWIFAGIEVDRRLWPSTVVGRRSCQNALGLFCDVSKRSGKGGKPLIVTDGFEFYRRLVSEVIGKEYLYVQVIKTRRHNRVVKVGFRGRLVTRTSLKGSSK